MSLPPLDLLKETHSFPGTYIFKVIGQNDPYFPSSVTSAVREKMHLERDPAFSVRKSDTGKHQSVTIEVEVQNAEDVHIVYERLLKVPGVLLLL